MPVSTECAAALLSFRYPSIPYIGTKFRGFGDKVFRGVLFPQFQQANMKKGH